jgi:hypothetical protein
LKHLLTIAVPIFGSDGLNWQEAIKLFRAGGLLQVHRSGGSSFDAPIRGVPNEFRFLAGTTDENCALQCLKHMAPVYEKSQRRFANSKPGECIG